MYCISVNHKNSDAFIREKYALNELEYKEFYMPKNKPEIVNVPKANYIAVRGKGNPNEEGGAYQQAISVL